MSKENKVTVQSVVRGFHVYKAICQLEESEKLFCEHEENNKYDLFATKVCQPFDRKIVGHLPIEILRITQFIIACWAIVEAQLTDANYRRSPLVQGGLEIPCLLTFKMPATKKTMNCWRGILNFLNQNTQNIRKSLFSGLSTKRIL